MDVRAVEMRVVEVRVGRMGGESGWAGWHGQDPGRARVLFGVWLGWGGRVAVCVCGGGGGGGGWSGDGVGAGGSPGEIESVSGCSVGAPPITYAAGT